MLYTHSLVRVSDDDHSLHGCEGKIVGTDGFDEDAGIHYIVRFGEEVDGKTCNYPLSDFLANELGIDEKLCMHVAVLLEHQLEEIPAISVFIIAERHFGITTPSQCTAFGFDDDEPHICMIDGCEEPAPNYTTTRTWGEKVIQFRSCKVHDDCYNLKSESVPLSRLDQKPRAETA